MGKIVVSKWASEDEVRKFILDNDYTVKEYSKNRISNMPNKNILKNVYGKSFGEIKGRKAPKEYATAEVVQDFIIKNNYTEKGYDTNRLPIMPHSASFKGLYSKTFGEIKGSVEWMSEQDVRDFILGNDYTYKEYARNRLHNMPNTTDFRKHYNKTFGEIKGGNDWATEQEVRDFIVINSHSVISYNLKRLSNMPNTVHFRKHYDKTFGEIKNKYLGVRKKYCTIEQFIKYLNHNNVNLDREYRTHRRANEVPNNIPPNPNKTYPNFSWYMVNQIRLTPKAKNILLDDIGSDLLETDPTLAFYMVDVMGIQIDGLKSLLMSNTTNRQSELKSIQDRLQGKDDDIEETDHIELIDSEEFSENVITEYRSEDAETIFSMAHKAIEATEKSGKMVGKETEAKELIEFIKRFLEEKLWDSLINGESTIEDIEKEAPKEYKHIANKIVKDFNAMHQLPLTDYICKEYLPNTMQRRTTLKLKENNSYGNWSGVGSGKTLSALLAGRENNYKNTLIITNNSTIGGWKESIEKHYGIDNNIFIKDIESTPEEGKFNYYLMNYEQYQIEGLNNKLKHFSENIKIDYVIVDEVHFAKQRVENTKSIRRETIEKLLFVLRNKNVDMRTLSMTATPIINNYVEGVKLLELITGKKYDELSTDHKSIYAGLGIRKHLILNGTISRQNKVIVNNKTQKVNRIELKPIILDVEKSTKLLEENDMVHELTYFQKILPYKLDIVKNQLSKGTIIYTPYVDGIVDVVKSFCEAKGFSCGYFIGEDKSGMKDFLKGNLDILIASSSISVGVDGLQKVSNKLIKLLTPWTSSENTQLEGRINRQGSLFESVDIVEPVVKLTLPSEGCESIIYSRDDYRQNTANFKKTIANIAMYGMIPEDLTISKTNKDMISKANEVIRLATNIVNDSKNIAERETIEFQNYVYENLVEKTTWVENGEKPCIYIIKNVHSGECYIGRTSRLAPKRWSEHFKGNGENSSAIQIAINENRSHFSCQILEEYDFGITEQDLAREEQKYINMYDSVNNGYNHRNEIAT